MPILYAAVINRHQDVVFEGHDKKFKSNYKDQVFAQYNRFVPNKSNTIELDGQHSLHYQHEGSWVVVAISQKPDVTLYEAMNFLDRLKQVLTQVSAGDNEGIQRMSEIEEMQSFDAPQRFKKHSGKVSDLITKWNADPGNRDQTYLVF
jgi:Synaptobrevin